MVINENWRINTDNEGCTLIYSEEKVRQEGKDKGQIYLYEQKYYYPSVATCLKAFLNKSLEDSVDVKDCLERITLAEKQILSAVQQ